LRTILQKVEDIVSPVKGTAGGRSEALPESARVQPSSMLDVPGELALEKM